MSTSGAPMRITVHSRRQCANKVRREYRLPRPLSLDSLGHFEDATIELQEFADLVPGAADHVTLRWGSHVAVSGAVGGQLLIGIFHRIRRGEYPHSLVKEFEERLAAVLGIPVVAASVSSPDRD